MNTNQTPLELARQTVEALEAFEKDNTVELEVLASQGYWANRSCLEILSTHHYRLKPKPKKRLITFDELPFPIQVKSETGDWILLEVARNKRELFLGSTDKLTGATNEGLAKAGGEWSTDGKTWHSFWVEEKT